LYLQESIRDGDLIVVMGAGPVTSIAHALVECAKASFEQQ